MMDQITPIDKIHRLAHIAAWRPARNTASDAFAIEDIEFIDAGFVCAEAAAAEIDSAVNAGMQTPDPFIISSPAVAGEYHVIGLRHRRGAFP